MFSVTYFILGFSVAALGSPIGEIWLPFGKRTLSDDMKAFRTEIKVPPATRSMGLKTRIVTQGSCFSDAIGDRLAEHKLKVLVNPFGVIYNPQSIHKALSYSIFNEPVAAHTFVHHNDIYFNYDFHSAFSALTAPELSTRLINSIGASHYFLKDADWLLITYGTAWVYQRQDTGEIVANCHKLPSANFSKSLMSVEQIQSSFAAFFEQLKKFNPEIRAILTVSPVRHIKDTLELSSVSKAILRVACHSISEQYADVEYFPAYEMMMDDLRDYRFYKSDMLHPTAEAEDYIWDKFMERYFSTDLKDFVKQWDSILSALRHKPFHPGTPAHQQFLRDTLKKLENIKRMDIDVEEEISQVSPLIIN